MIAEFQDGVNCEMKADDSELPSRSEVRWFSIIGRVKKGKSSWRVLENARAGSMSMVDHPTTIEANQLMRLPA